MITYDDIKKANDEITTMPITSKKGIKDYAQVNERITAFRKVYPTGYIVTDLISIEDGICVFKAFVGYYEGDRKNELGTGTAYEKEGSTFINENSYIENCETSAVGRALGMAGFGIKTSVASYEEVQTAILNEKTMSEDEARAFVITFGKNKGKTLGELHDTGKNYYSWLKDNAKDRKVIKAIEAIENAKPADNGNVLELDDLPFVGLDD